MKNLTFNLGDAMVDLIGRARKEAGATASTDASNGAQQEATAAEMPKMEVPELGLVDKVKIAIAMAIIKVYGHAMTLKAKAQELCSKAAATVTSAVTKAKAAAAKIKEIAVKAVTLAKTAPAFAMAALAKVDEVAGAIAHNPWALAVAAPFMLAIAANAALAIAVAAGLGVQGAFWLYFAQVVAGTRYLVSKVTEAAVEAAAPVQAAMA